MLRDLVAAFHQARHQQLFGIAVTKDDAWPARWGNHVDAVPQLLIRERLRLPCFNVRPLWSGNRLAPRREVGILNRASARRTLPLFRAELAKAPAGRQVGKVKNGAVVTVNRKRSVVSIRDRSEE